VRFSSSSAAARVRKPAETGPKLICCFLWDDHSHFESLIRHVFRTAYYVTTDLYAELFLQSNTLIDKETVQALTVWRIFPPFGSLQFAYQRGTSSFGEESARRATPGSLSWRGCSDARCIGRVGIVLLRGVAGRQVILLQDRMDYELPCYQRTTPTTKSSSFTA
jgi:hypothetical protein